MPRCTLAQTGRFDAVICLGCLIKGDTMHFEYIAEAASQGIMNVSVTTGVPVAFGVLTTMTDEQAIARSAPGDGNKGREAALAAIEMATLFKRLGGAPHGGRRRVTARAEKRSAPRRAEGVAASRARSRVADALSMGGRAAVDVRGASDVLVARRRDR